MFNNHTMSLVTDLAILGPAINDYDFIAIGAVTTDISSYPDLRTIYNVGILVPPVEMLQEWADEPAGNVLAYEYPSYLAGPEPDSVIVALIAAMTKKNIILYVPHDNYAVFGPLLHNHIRMMYGIQAAMPGFPFMIDQSKIPFIISKLYVNDLMLPNDFLAMYPGNYILPNFVIPKLAQDLHPFDRPAQYQEYERYFNDLNRAKLQANTEMFTIVNNGGGKE